ncbi:MAG: hypothetical protein HY841_05435 [Bacteroidetes bacterium]|nr:hypothetical protein [Bacteroidota bacterium]
MSEKIQFQNPNNKILIEAVFIISLEELAFVVFPHKENPSRIISVLRHQPKRAETEARREVKHLLKKFPEVKLKNLEFDYIDSGNLTHGCAYFKAKISGTEHDLREVTEKEKIFVYDWE